MKNTPFIYSGFKKDRFIQSSRRVSQQDRIACGTIVQARNHEKTFPDVNNRSVIVMLQVA